jgi:dihydropteroate synthase
MEMSLLIRHQLMHLSSPRVMAIINFSPDSFYTSCDVTAEEQLLLYVEKVLAEGADILDLGACSTRPNSTPVDAATEWRLLCQGLDLIRHHWHQVPISVDTFRAEIAEQALAHGADIINDVSGANADSRMWDVVAKHCVPYVLTHAQAIQEHLMAEVIDFLQQHLDRLHRRGVADVIIDPGFGFGKTLEQNYALLQHLDVLQELHAPLLVGVSRKSMLYKPLQTTPDNVLAATVAANTLALERGANILRVHDVAAAVQAIHIYQLSTLNTKH